VDEVAYATTLGIDTIITDHHQALDRVPEPIACVNPQVSPNMPFKEICGASVAFKLCLGVAQHENMDRTLVKRLYDRMLPFVSIATIADCMPLIDENRLLVKK
jgi:single-stranded-DNA-specific exonuclease